MDLHLLAWTVIGLGLGAILRFVAAKVPVYSPSQVLLGTVMIGTRLSLGWRPEPLDVADLAAAALLLVSVWCAVALRGAAVVRRSREASLERWRDTAARYEKTATACPAGLRMAGVLLRSAR